MAFMTDTTFHDRLYNVKADLPHIRKTITQAAIISMVALQTLGLQMAMGVPSLMLSVTKTAEEPQILSLYINALVWLILLFGDLKKAKMIETRWLSLVLYCATSIVLLGPGATLLVGWTWREEIFATKKHWAAVTKAG